MIRNVGGPQTQNMLTVACNVQATFQGTIAVGDWVLMGTSSNWAVNSGAVGTSLLCAGQVLDLSESSDVATVRFPRGLGVIHGSGGSVTLGHTLEMSDAATSVVMSSSNATNALAMLVVAIDDPTDTFDAICF